MSFAKHPLHNFLGLTASLAQDFHNILWDEPKIKDQAIRTQVRQLGCADDMYDDLVKFIRDYRSPKGTPGIELPHAHPANDVIVREMAADFLKAGAGAKYWPEPKASPSQKFSWPKDNEQ